jgi:hypothetical protein
MQMSREEAIADAEQRRDQVESMLSRQRARASTHAETARKPGVSPMENVRALGKAVESMRKKKRGY